MRRKRLNRRDVAKITTAKTTQDYNAAIMAAELKLGRRLTRKDLKL